MLPTNLALLQIAKRAERQDDDVLQKTFVDFGAVFVALASIDHQIIFGRRGTGKTHLLTVLRQHKLNENEVAIQLDMRNLGSSGGIYSDSSIPLAQRATRLLIDVLAAIHARLMELAIDEHGLVNLGTAGSALNELFVAHSSVKVVGTTTVEEGAHSEHSSGLDFTLGISGQMVAPSLTGGVKLVDSARDATSGKKIVAGHEVHRVNFGQVGDALRKVTNKLPKSRLWLLFDEWSEVPLDLQPFLADLLRRAVLPTKGITVKIAAIEQRSRFRISNPTVGSIGLELGSDLSPAINLDDYMVFDNEVLKAVAFFKSLVLKHVQAALEALGLAFPQNEAELISQGFTQSNAFEEVVRACEGVPRDALHILSHAAQRAGDGTISVSDVRAAAQQWYQGSKDAAVSANEKAKSLLLWIVDKVIKERRTKAFLLESGTRDNLIDYLYDERVLHLLLKSTSAKDAPGRRFHVYGIDYGCYVDLMNTAKAPQGILDLGDDDSDFSITVPKTDFRSIRRSVLDLKDFYSNLKA